MSTLTTASDVTYSTADEIALHLGVAPQHLLAVTKELNTRLQAAVSVEGDGWNVWGEAVGNDLTLHLVAEMETVANTEDEIAAVVHDLYDSRLITVSTDRWHTVAVLTCVPVWGEEAGGVLWTKTPTASGLSMTRYDESPRP